MNDCPECKNIEDDQYTCTTCWKTGGIHAGVADPMEDEFECEGCHKIFDIEESTKLVDDYFCLCCAVHVKQEIKDDSLPYSFDLLYNIKTKTQLAAKYLELKLRLASIEETCRDHNIDLSKIEEN